MKKEVIKLQARPAGASITFYITIPKKFIQELGWKKGDPILIELDEEKKMISVKKISLD